MLWWCYDCCLDSERESKSMGNKWVIKKNIIQRIKFAKEKTATIKIDLGKSEWSMYCMYNILSWQFCGDIAVKSVYTWLWLGLGVDLHVWFCFFPTKNKACFHTNHIVQIHTKLHTCNIVLFLMRSFNTLTRTFFFRNTNSLFACGLDVLIYSMCWSRILDLTLHKHDCRWSSTALDDVQVEKTYSTYTFI